MAEIPRLDDPAELAALESAADVAARLLDVFGHPMTATGLLQTVAVYRPRPGRFRVLRITPETPRSPTDQFSLMVARARADAILTTGRNLRLEPQGRHLLEGPDSLSSGSSQHSLPAALEAWRRERLGKSRPPYLLVLSRGQDLDLDHPAFKALPRTFVLTGREGAFHLESRAADRGIEVVAVAEPSAAAAVDFLRRELGAATISVEAGPSVARELYDPVEIDEIQLSILDLPDPAALASALRGPFFLDQAELEQLFRWSPAYRRATAEGLWSFRRLVRL